MSGTRLKLSLATVIEALRTAPRQVDETLVMAAIEADALPEGTHYATFSGALLNRMVEALEEVERERADLYQRLAIKRIAEAP